MSNVEIEHEYTNEIVCPWCGYTHGDCGEYTNDNDDNFECNECGKYFSYQRDIEVTYSTERKKCGDKCDYQLDEDKIKNPYIYNEKNWTIWKCSKCHDNVTKLGNISEDKIPYIQNIEEPNVDLFKKEI